MSSAKLNTSDANSIENRLFKRILKSKGTRAASCATLTEICFDELHEEPILTLCAWVKMILSGNYKLISEKFS